MKPVWRMAAFAILTLLNVAKASAAPAGEHLYAPPVGSRWIIVSETRTDEISPGGPRTLVVITRSELSIDETTGDSFRVSFVNRGATVDGNSPTVLPLRSAMNTLKNVTIRATTDASGKPIRVDNLDEAKAVVRSLVTQLLQSFQDSPQLLAALNQIAARLLDVDAEKAATLYLEDVPLLAKAQNTGMSLGDIRRTSGTASNSFGGAALMSDSTLELIATNPMTGTARFVEITVFDSTAMKEFTRTLTKNMLAAIGDGARSEEIDSLARSMTLSINTRTTFDVEDGMTRQIARNVETRSSMMGHSHSKVETKTVTVTRAP
jgi:hypothetical protein